MHSTINGKADGAVSMKYAVLPGDTMGMWVLIFGLLIGVVQTVSADEVNESSGPISKLMNFTSNLKTESNPLNSAVSVMTNVAGNLNFYGKVGLQLWDQTVNSRLQLSDQRLSGLEEVDTDVFLGVGGGLDVNRHVSVGGELTHFQFESKSVTLVSVNAAYHF